MKKILILALLTSTAAFANVNDGQFPLNDLAYRYNCGLSIKSTETGELLSYKILRNGYGYSSTSGNPPGNAQEILIQESDNAGIVEAFQLYSPSKPFWKKEQQQAVIELYRRIGRVEDEGIMGLDIPAIESDTLLGELTVKGTGNAAVLIDKYSVELNCIQNPDKKD